MKEPVSIFNDVIGPVMIGPSSSHTAAGARIGYFIRRMLNDQPERVTFTFSTNGSLADCHEPQGTDMGLAGGLQRLIVVARVEDLLQRGFGVIGQL